LVIFYTDGLVEARRGQEGARPEGFLRRLEAHGGLPPRILGRVSVGPRRLPHGYQPADDVTLIVVKVL